MLLDAHFTYETADLCIPLKHSGKHQVDRPVAAVQICMANNCGLCMHMTMPAAAGCRHLQPYSTLYASITPPSATWYYDTEQP